MSSPGWRDASAHGGLRLARAVAGLLPERAALGLGALVGLLAGSVLRIRRRDVDRHLALAFPEATARWRSRIARASYTHLGREAVMLLRITDWPPERLLERVSFDGVEEVAAAAREGGAVLLTGHVGNWELAGAALAAFGLEIDAIVKRMTDPRFESDLSALRERLGVRRIDTSQAPREVVRSLRRGRVVAIVGDQNAAEGGVFLPFFGRDASTARGPALFALRTGAPVFAGAALRAPGAPQRYRIAVRRIPVRSSGDLERDVRTLLSAYNTVLEEAIRGAPEQYFWQHRRWKTRPEQEPFARS